MEPIQMPATLEAPEARPCRKHDQIEVLALACTVVPDARTMCAALCTSSSAKQAIVAKCSGSLQLQLEPEVDDPDDDTAALAALRRMVQQTAWLAQNGGLVGQLQLQSATGTTRADEMAWSLRPPLQLRCLQLNVDLAVPLMKQLDPSRLTRLEYDEHRSHEVSSPLLPAALSRLTGLQQLAVTGCWGPLHDSMAAALAGMPQLTQLLLEPQLPAAALAQLPSQLVELQLSNPQCEAAQLVAHVKALQQLQSLTLVYYTTHTGIDISVHAKVWGAIPQLQQLEVGIANGQLGVDLATGIAQATSLTRLYGGFGVCSAHVDLLAMLAPLKRLQSLDLTVADSRPLQSFKRLFSDLSQLRSLTLDIPSLPQLAVAQVCLQATQLTELVLCCDSLKEDHIIMIADSMAELQRLALVGDMSSLSGALVSAFAPPNRAACNPPRLEQLAVVNTGVATMRQRAAAAKVLSEAWLSVSGHVIVEERRVDIPSGFVGACHNFW